jgi:hypothetical protein
MDYYIVYNKAFGKYILAINECSLINETYIDIANSISIIYKTLYASKDCKSQTRYEKPEMLHNYHIMMTFESHSRKELEFLLYLINNYNTKKDKLENGFTLIAT